MKEGFLFLRTGLYEWGGKFEVIYVSKKVDKRGGAQNVLLSEKFKQWLNIT